MDLWNPSPACNERSEYGEPHLCLSRRRKPVRSAARFWGIPNPDSVVSSPGQHLPALWPVPSGRDGARACAKTASDDFRLISRWCRCSRVEGFRTMAERRSRARRMKSVHTPAMKRSAACKLGARLRPRFRMSSCCRTSTDSASTLRGPPGFASRKTVTMKWTTRTRKSLISGNRTRAPQMLDSGGVQEFAMNRFRNGREVLLQRLKCGQRVKVLSLCCDDSRDEEYQRREEE